MPPRRTGVHNNSQIALHIAMVGAGNIAKILVMKRVCMLAMQNINTQNIFRKKCSFRIGWI